MANRRIDPREQFSKKLAKWTAIYWFVHMTLLSAIMLIEPQTAMFVVYMAIVSSVVMLINIYSYCKNSLTEKALLTLIDKTRIELKSNSINTEQEETNECEVGVENG